MKNQIKYIKKALQMEIIKPQIHVMITKSELSQLVTEALANPDTAPAVKRAITPLLANSFPQFPEFSQVSLGVTDETGATEVILKQPKVVNKPTLAESEKVETEEIEEKVETEEPEADIY